MASGIAPSFLNQLSAEFGGGETLNRIASAIGETPGKTHAALSSVLPALMSGLATKASTGEGATELLDVIKRNNLDSSQYANIAGALGTPNAAGNLITAGNSILNTVFGGRTNALTNWIATQAGILGLGGATAAASRTITDAENRFATFAAEVPRAQSSIWKWLGPLLLLLGLLGLFAWLLNRAKAPQVAAPPPVTVPAPPNVAIPAVTPPSIPAVNLGALIDKILPNGASLRIPTDGVENRLLGFIGDASKKVDKDTWFSFDRLEFETGSAVLKPTSQEQLRNIAEILKAYPNVALKIGGYTDNTGNPVQNLKLSQDRASRTMSELVALGIDKSRLAAEGYGDKFPVADNATEAGRQRNRRIDIRVTKK